ncbi:MAG: imidazole glycerol phosphate synthase subunit HisH, partial [Halofilum sp. (in: g-proteobacteria)]
MCMGLQVLLGRSEENGGTDCLGVFGGEVRAFAPGLSDADGARLKIPHMGWNEVVQRPHPLWDGIANNTRFYFVHGYYATPADTSLVVGTTDYGHDFCSALAHGNLFACQFHPEKSSTAGLTLLHNFLRWDGGA